MASFTKNAIKKAFIKLLEERPLGKITVRDITDACGINRNSFYYHYQDIPTLLSEIVSEDADRIIAQYPKVESVSTCIDAAVNYALSYKRVVKHIFDSVNRDILELYLMRVSEYVVTAYFNTVTEGAELSEIDKASFIRYYKCLMFGFVVDWMNGGMNEEVVEQFKRFIEMRHNLISDVNNI